MNVSESKHHPLIKICGITRKDDAKHAADSGADFLGFIFVENTPRYIEPNAAGKISSSVQNADYVGVFMDEDPEKVNTIAELSGLSFLQLHGDESPEYCQQMRLPIIKAFRIKPDMDEDDIYKLISPYKNCAEYVLLDAWHPDAAGGTGHTFDWSTAKKLHKDFRIILAGGLKPENVKHAVQAVKPFGIDVSSGVEISPGIKDHDKISQLIESVRS
ncbi:MAG: phosphoribosylanthranilate isomerase [Balneolia bacterium]|nr:phosphoribosylanthranilate isomerase [Balneolia bacterium]